MKKSDNHVRFISKHGEVVEMLKNWLFLFLSENPTGSLKDCKMDDTNFQITYHDKKYKAEVQFSLNRNELYWTSEGIPEELKELVAYGLRMYLPA